MRSRCIGSVAANDRAVEPEASSRNPLPARAEPLAEVRDRPRAEGNVDERVQLEDAFALRLGVAAADGDHARRIGTLACGLRTEVRGELRIRLLADRAGVEHDDVGLVGVGCLTEPELLEEPFDPLRVVRVHLAAERVHVVAPHDRHRVPRPRAGAWHRGARHLPSGCQSGGVDSLAALLELVRGHVHGSALADHRHADLAGVLEVILDLAGDLV